jgi:hypothetical protein
LCAPHPPWAAADPQIWNCWTGAHALVLPIILTCLSATFTAEGLGGRPIYSLLLAQGDHPPPSPRRPERRVLAAGLILVALLGLERLTGSAPGIMPATPLAGTTSEDRTAPSGAVTPSPAPLVQDQPRFAIQLLTVNSDAGLTAFAQQHGLFGQVRTLKGRHRDKDWYALLLGDYATQAEAEAALAALPAGLRRLKPLVRPLSAGTRLLPVQAPPEPGDGSRF